MREKSSSTTRYTFRALCTIRSALCPTLMRDVSLRFCSHHEVIRWTGCILHLHRDKLSSFLIIPTNRSDSARLYTAFCLTEVWVWAQLIRRNKSTRSSIHTCDWGTKVTCIPINRNRSKTSTWSAPTCASHCRISSTTTGASRFDPPGPSISSWTCYSNPNNA